MKTGQKRRMFIVFFGIFALVVVSSSRSFGADPLNRCEREFDNITRNISNKWLKANQFCFKKLFQCSRVSHCSDNNTVSACSKKLQKASASIERNIKQLAVGCNRIELSVILEPAGGLSWASNEKMCQEFGVSIKSKDDVFLCLKKIVQCKAEQLTATGNPLAERIFEDNNLLGPDGLFIGCITRDESVCGNGIHEQGEECDGGVLDASCRRLGFIRGELKCSSACTLDTSKCEDFGYFPARQECPICQVCQECPACPECPTCQICQECPESLPCPE